jgi:hypothetical protein
MTDRELPELAARAAGIDYYARAQSGGMLTDNGEWNPDNDDGDAFRLAVRCAQRFGFYRFMRAWLIAMATEPGDASDPYAATRRAIVRAAAELERSKT